MVSCSVHDPAGFNTIFMHKIHLSYLIIPLLCVLFPTISLSKVQVPSVFSDHMILQRNTVAPIWGRAEPGEMITVIASWEPIELTTYADSKGLWRIDMMTQKAGGPFEITIKASNVIEIEDVWFGEVWIASGQSNMNWPVRRSDGGEEAIAEADYPNIRLFQVPRTVSTTPRFDSKGEWKACSPTTVASFSAVAYYFGRELHHGLDVPIGLIQTTWGGSTAEAWTSREALGEIDAFVPYLEEFDDAMRDFRAYPNRPDPVTHKSPTSLFNAMLHPLIPFAMQGVLWYQGEANVSDPYLYRQLFPGMIDDWRNRWQEKFSFYYVQLAPFRYQIPRSGAGLREAQLLTQKKANTGMVVTLDVGDPTDIHPTDKRTVGHRLFQWAMANNYGEKTINPSGPVFQQMDKQGAELRLHFKHAEGLWDGNHALSSFEIAGSDRVFFPASAEIEGETIRLSHPEIAHPQAVRYAFSDTAQAALYNAAGLPASSFRTDDWTEFYTQPQIHASYHKEEDDFLISMEYRQILDHTIHYSLANREATASDSLYEKSFRLKGPAIIHAQAFIEGQASPYPVSRLIRRHLGVGKSLNSSPAPVNRFKGKVLDGLHASLDHRDIGWFGMEGEDLVLTVDLEEKQTIRQVDMYFLQNHARRIFLPGQIRYEVSNNGTRFKEVDLWVSEEVEQLSQASTKSIERGWKSTKARFLKVTLINPGPIPTWHRQAGERSIILLDEIVIE